MKPRRASPGSVAYDATQPADTRKRKLRHLLKELDHACVTARYCAQVAKDAEARGDHSEAAGAQSLLIYWLNEAERIDVEISTELNGA